MEPALLIIITQLYSTAVLVNYGELDFKMGYLQRHLKYILMLSQLFGVLPVSGIFSDDPLRLRFSWLSWRVLYTCCLILATFFLVLMSFYNLCTNDFELSNLTTFVFFSNGFIVITVFLKLATEWPEFMRYWHSTEMFIKSKVLLPKGFVSLPFIILSAAAIEHGLFVTYRITFEEFNGNITINGFEHFMTNDVYVFNYISYTWYLGVFLKFTSVINTFYWNFMDVFVIIMSMALAEMLTLINDRIRYSNEIKISEWTEIRRQYNRVCELCNRLEDKISPVILLSFSSNLYFILVQLHGSVEKRDTIMKSVYFFYSFGLLLLRTLAVCLFVARIDDESKATLRLMGCLRAFNSESKRLLQQIVSTKMALSGMNFFSVTRGLILNIAAAIVTYEIFFIQYVNTAT